MDYISSYAGAENEGRSAVKILAKVLTNEVAMFFNWKGTAPKEAFRSLRIMEATLGE